MTGWLPVHIELRLALIWMPQPLTSIFTFTSSEAVTKDTQTPISRLTFRIMDLNLGLLRRICLPWKQKFRFCCERISTHRLGRLGSHNMLPGSAFIRDAYIYLCHEIRS